MEKRKSVKIFLVTTLVSIPFVCLVIYYLFAPYPGATNPKAVEERDNLDAIALNIPYDSIPGIRKKLGKDSWQNDYYINRVKCEKRSVEYDFDCIIIVSPGENGKLENEYSSVPDHITLQENKVDDIILTIFLKDDDMFEWRVHYCRMLYSSHLFIRAQKAIKDFLI